LLGFPYSVYSGYPRPLLSVTFLFY
jgi:hypothetical protein